jgi:hypothetical protein
MKVRNIKAGKVADCEWRTDHPESIRLTNLKAKSLRDLFGVTAQVDPEPVLVIKETGELFKCNPLMLEREGDPAGPRLGLPNGGQGFFLDENLKPTLRQTNENISE